MKTEVKDVIKLAKEPAIGQEATSGFSQFNFVNDGSVEVNENVKQEKGIGGSVFHYSVVDASLSVGGFLSNSDLSLLTQLFCNADYTPNSFTIIAGNSAVGLGVKLVGSIPSEITLDSKAGDPIKYSVKFDAMLCSPVTSIPTPTPPNKTDIVVWHDATVNINGNEYHVAEWKLTWKQPIKLEADFSPKDSGKKRMRNVVGWGYPEVSFSCKVYLPFSADIAADLPNTVDVTITIGNMTVVLNDLFVSKRGFPVKGGDDLWVMDLDLEGHEASLSIQVS